ncbi:hypothetical protein BSKO_13329 [Bryopsis sp. KO-2023]|nr:hypothetical protein BSKO_13328 [Bryopsis sp. KO-2023]GMH45372.1 hypothetical protein BSKO_13329 [Bryopsis sp. KO-2023]
MTSPWPPKPQHVERGQLHISPHEPPGSGFEKSSIPAWTPVSPEPNRDASAKYKRLQAYVQVYTVQAYTRQAYTLQAYSLQAYTLQAYTLQAYTLQAYTLQAYTCSTPQYYRATPV